LYAFWGFLRIFQTLVCFLKGFCGVFVHFFSFFVFFDRFFESFLRVCDDLITRKPARNPEKSSIYLLVTFRSPQKPLKKPLYLFKWNKSSFSVLSLKRRYFKLDDLTLKFIAYSNYWFLWVWKKLSCKKHWIDKMNRN
jgi:hypothetical protein